MNKVIPPRFDVFLANKVASGQLSPELLPEIVGKENANRILDNSLNATGAPAIGGRHIAIQHGAISEILGALPDAKGELNAKKELVDSLNLEGFNTQKDNLESELDKQNTIEDSVENEMADDHLPKPR